MTGAGVDWIFWLLSAVVALGGLWLLYWSLLHDRSRGRRRCPKCWYDLSGTPHSLICSECGHTAKRERKLFKTRRRWRWVAPAAIFLVIAAAFSRGPHYIQRGFAGALPTTFLLAAMPWIEEHQGTGNRRAAMLDELLFERVGINKPAAQCRAMWIWQWRWLCTHAINNAERHRRGLQQRQIFQRARTPSWDILDAACKRGVLHSLELQDRYAALLPPPHVAVLKSPTYAGGPVRIQFQSRDSSTVPGKDVRAHLPDGARLRLEEITPPQGGEPAIVDWPVSYALWLPDSTGELTIEFRTQIAVNADRVDVNSPSTLPLILSQFMNIDVRERQDYLRVADDLDELIRDDCRIELIAAETAAIRVRVSDRFVLNASNFSRYVWSLALMRDGQIVFEDSRRLDVILEGTEEWGAAEAVYPLPLAAISECRTAWQNGDNSKWSIRFGMNAEQMFLWTYSSNLALWDGTVEKPFSLAEFWNE